MQDDRSATISARPWLPEPALQREAGILASPAATGSGESVVARIESLIETNRTIHEHDCVNLNPATNVLNPRAEAALAGALGSRPSLGYPGMKYEMGLEAIEEIEVVTAALACRVFSARYAEVRVGSGALANLYSFMATCEAGDAIIVPPPTIGGHVTHNTAGAAGLFGLDIHEAPIDADRYTVDVDGVAALAERIKPKLITIGSSLNLVPHPVAELRSVADAVGAKLLCDAAHMSSLFGGNIWPDPLAEGAHLLTMSTYKSLGGPAGGLLLTNDAELAERVDAIAYPGLTANFDAGKTAALAITLVDWLEHGPAYAAEMVATAAALAAELEGRGLGLQQTPAGPTTSHQFAVDASQWGGGHAAAERLREANILACAIGLPLDAGAGTMSGLRLGTPEAVRWGMTPEHMAELGGLINDGLRSDPTEVAARTTDFRQRFTSMRFLAT